MMQKSLHLFLVMSLAWMDAQVLAMTERFITQPLQESKQCCGLSIVGLCADSNTLVTPRLHTALCLPSEGLMFPVAIQPASSNNLALRWLPSQPQSRCTCALRPEGIGAAGPLPRPTVGGTAWQLCSSQSSHGGCKLAGKWAGGDCSTILAHAAGQRGCVHAG